MYQNHELWNAIFTPNFSLHPKNPVFLSALSGFTTGEFAIKVAKAGAGSVTIGGFCLDKKTYVASQQMRSRGRAEFSIPPKKLAKYLLPSLDLLSELEIPVFINVRFLDPNSLSTLIDGLPYSNIILELNAHCRQIEMTSIGAGQAFCNNIQLLEESLDIIDSRIPISLKIRGNESTALSFVEKFNKLGGDILHVDSYQSGQKEMDTNLLNQFREIFNGFLIANNSVTASIAVKLLKNNINAVSIGRKAQFNPSAPAELWQEIKALL